MSFRTVTSKAISLLAIAFLLSMVIMIGKPMSVLAMFWIVSFLFVWISNKYKHKIVFICIGIFLLSFIFQSCYSVYVRLLGDGDLKFYYNNAVHLAENAFKIESLYHATFPGTVTYPFVVALFFKVLGIHRIVPVLLNQAVMSATIVMVYLFIKQRHNHICGAAGALLMATHPFVIIYCNTPNAELLYGACILWSFFLFYYACEKYKLQGQTNVFTRSFSLPLAFSALFLGLSQLFRPLGIILLIAFLLYTLLLSRMRIKEIIYVCSFFLAGFIGFNMICGVIILNTTTYDTPKSSYGWNLYVGASDSGRWNQTDADEFSQVIATVSTPTELHSYFASKAIDRYKEMGFGIIRHGRNKFRSLNSAEYMIQEAFLLTEVSAKKHTLSENDYAMPIYLYYVPILVFALAFVFRSFIQLFRMKHDSFIILPFYVIGSFMAFAFLEVAPRYAVSYHILFTILAFEMLLITAKYIGKGRLRKMFLQLPSV